MWRGKKELVDIILSLTTEYKLTEKIDPTTNLFH